jgi:predicted nucleic acid-binding protein
MTLVYLDTSAVLKLFFREPFSAEVETAVTVPDAHCITSDLTYAEIHGSLSRALSQGRLTRAEQKFLVQEFAVWFGGITHVALSFKGMQRAGQLAIKCNLRGADAIHLNTAVECVGLPSHEKRVFACFDRRLTEEAINIGFFDEFVTDPDWLPQP